MATIVSSAKDGDVVLALTKAVMPEIVQIVPDAGSHAANEVTLLADALYDVVQATGRTFAFVLDKWDAPYRLAQSNTEAQDAYAEWLRSIFKNLNYTAFVVAGAYMTGILPIKKYNHQSAVSDFNEFTMVDPAQYVPYVGFGEAEVATLCEKHRIGQVDVRRGYDGYELPAFRPQGTQQSHVNICAPYSVMKAKERGSTGSYWPSTETFEELRTYIDMNFEGLQADILRAIGGEELRVDPEKYQNDMVSIASRDDVPTLLVQAGYLCCDRGTKRARVPNEEVHGELRRTVEGSRHDRKRSCSR